MFLAGTYLIAAFLGGYFARMLKLPPLLGFLVAGFVLKAMDVPGHPLVDSLANLGVTLMLFVVGLELDIRQLLRREVWHVCCRVVRGAAVALVDHIVSVVTGAQAVCFNLETHGTRRNVGIADDGAGDRSGLPFV